MAVDKLILSNKAALLKKYGKKGFLSVADSIAAMITADAKRGITSKIIYLDDESIRKYNAEPVNSVKNGRATKNAVDALYRWFTPDYIMLLGSQDVVPHIKVTNVSNDDDGLIIDSDLPYACDHAYTKDCRKYLAPTRVVGRLPDVNGSRDESYLVQVIRNAIAVKPQPRKAYTNWFAVSTREWTGSTSVSVANIFQEVSNLRISPPASKNSYRKLDEARVHFFNCHGANGMHVFYGQHGEQYPVSFHSASVPEKLLPGTVVAAECCYGGQQYAPGEGELPISSTYLLNNCAAYVGSTTVAYGPADGQGSADLLTQYFLKFVLAGHSVGRAFLEARHKFVAATTPHMDPVDLKTLEQFLLLGDPSLHLVERAHSGLYRDERTLHVEDKNSHTFFRKARRKQLREDAAAAAAQTSVHSRVSDKIPAERDRKFSKLVRMNGIREVASVQRFDFGKKGSHYVYVEKKKKNAAHHYPRVMIFREWGSQVDVKLYERK